MEVTNEEVAEAVRHLLIEVYGIDEYLAMFNQAYWNTHKEESKNEGTL